MKRSNDRKVEVPKLGQLLKFFVFLNLYDGLERKFNQNRGDASIYNNHI